MRPSASQEPVRPPPNPSASLAVSTYLARLSVVAMGAVIGVLIARGLGVQGRGQVAFVAGVYYVALLALNLGYENALLHQQSERSVPPAALRRLGGFLALSSGAAGVSAVAVAAWALHGSLFADINPVWLVLGVGFLPAALDLVYLRALFQSNGRLDLVNRTTLAGAMTQLLVVVGAFVTGRLTVTVALVAVALGTVGPWGLLRMRARSFGRARLQGSVVRESLAFGLKSSLGISFLYLLYRFDFLAVKALLGTSALGRYSVATSVAQILWLVTDSLSLALIARQVAATPSGALDVTVRAVRKALLVLPLGAALLGAAGAVAIPLMFGPEFRAAVAPMLVLLPGVLAIGVVKPISVLLIRANRPGTLSLMSLAGLAMNVALLFPLARAFGIAGAAIASAAAYGLMAALFVRWLATRGVRLSALMPRRDDVLAVLRMASPANLRLVAALLLGEGRPQDRAGTNGTPVSTR